MEKNDKWFAQIPFTGPYAVREKSAPKYEYISASLVEMRIEAPKKSFFYAIQTETREEAEETLKKIKKTKIKYDSQIYLGEEIKIAYVYFQNARAILCDSNFVFGKWLTSSHFDHRYGGNHIFWGDHYIGKESVDFLKFKNFKIDFLGCTLYNYVKIESKRRIKFSKKNVSADIEEGIFKKVQETHFRNFKIEKENIEILKYNNKLYLCLNVDVDKKALMNEYETCHRTFIFELDEFMKNNRIVEYDLGDIFFKARSQISHLSIDRHDSIAF